jgi:DNA/RNA-binding protein KIN17
MNFLSNKVFAKQNKHRGLQKLKYYCEMCSRQCKDENGFKCHTQSEQHKRNMELFTSNPRLFIEKFSYEFEKSFLDLLRMQYSNKKVLANKLYKDFISDKDHTHMNSTKWSTLSGFLNYLKSTGKITIEETEKGPLIEYLDQSPQAIEQRKVNIYLCRMKKEN